MDEELEGGDKFGTLATFPPEEPQLVVILRLVLVPGSSCIKIGDGDLKGWSLSN